MNVITLPYPPSANRLWRNVGGKTIKSEAYRRWLLSAHWAAKQARPQPILGAYRLVIIASRPDERKRDIDNLIKPVSDLLKHAGVVVDDSLAASVYAGWGPDKVKGGSINVGVFAA